QYGGRFAGRRSPEHDEVGMLDLVEAHGAAPGTEHGRQTDDARSVSGPVAGIDVVGTDRDPSELLRQKVDFVRGLGARKDAERVGPAAVHNLPDTGRGPSERLVPSRGA